jgi:hypothetical protein
MESQLYAVEPSSADCGSSFIPQCNMRAEFINQGFDTLTMRSSRMRCFNKLLHRSQRRLVPDRG